MKFITISSHGPESWLEGTKIERDVHSWDGVVGGGFGKPPGKREMGRFCWEAGIKTTEYQDDVKGWHLGGQGRKNIADRIA